MWSGDTNFGGKTTSVGEVRFRQSVRKDKNGDFNLQDLYGEEEDESKYLHFPPNKYLCPHFSFSISPMALSAISPLPLAVSFGFHRPQRPPTPAPRFSYSFASLSSSSSGSQSAKPSSPTDNSNGTSSPFVEPSRAADSNFSYAFANPSAGGAALHPILGFMQSTESSIERVIFFFFFSHFSIRFS